MLSTQTQPHFATQRFTVFQRRCMDILKYRNLIATNDHFIHTEERFPAVIQIAQKQRKHWQKMLRHAEMMVRAEQWVGLDFDVTRGLQEERKSVAHKRQG